MFKSEHELVPSDPLSLARFDCGEDLKQVREDDMRTDVRGMGWSSGAVIQLSRSAELATIPYLSISTLDAGRTRENAPPVVPGRFDGDRKDRPVR